MLKTTTLFILLLIIATTLQANTLVIASGAGYKKPVNEIVDAYSKISSKPDVIFGNMRQISTQASKADISLIIGDKKFLVKKSGLDFFAFHKIGIGKAVVIYPKGSKLESLEDLKNSNITRIATPQPSKAIYGTAANESLKNSGIYNNIKDKLLIVATVPQVTTYVASGNVDAGIINLTDALASRDNIGGYFEIPQELYTKIEIVASELKSCKKNKECKKFVKFLKSDEVKEIVRRYGL